LPKSSIDIFIHAMSLFNKSVVWKIGEHLANFLLSHAMFPIQFLDNILIPYVARYIQQNSPCA